MKDRLEKSLTQRFGERLEVTEPACGSETLERIVSRGSCRAFRQEPVSSAMLHTLLACALSAPSKSDLQQADILHVADHSKRSVIQGLIPGMPWIADAPVFLVFLANNRRQRQLAGWRAKPWPNDHLDPFFNATVDAAIALGFFVVSAEAVGLGCCPISVIRNHSAVVSDLLELPDHVIPVAGLALGWPQFPTPRITPRLSLRTTLHTDRFDDEDVEAEILAYDERRRAIMPYREQRRVDVFGEDPEYGWSEEKARHYAEPERADFGAFVKRKGFRLE